MSFLSILLVASAFYFAHARPDWSTSWSAAHSAIDNAPAPEVPQEAAFPTRVGSDYQQQLSEFMQKMGKEIEQHITPFVPNQDETKQDESKTMDMNGFASYFNYLFGRL